MTETNTETNTETVPPTTNQTAPADPRPDFFAVVARTGELLADTDLANYNDPTPCAGYNVDQLCAHLVAVMQRIAAIGRSEDPFSVPQEAKASDGSWSQQWEEASADVQRVWADPSILARDVTVPFGVFPGAMTIVFYTGELAIHGWDLARATGRQPGYNDDNLRVALAAVRHGIPADGRDEEAMPFEAPIDIDSNEPIVDQLAAWTGHRW